MDGGGLEMKTQVSRSPALQAGNFKKCKGQGIFKYLKRKCQREESYEEGLLRDVG